MTKLFITAVAIALYASSADAHPITCSGRIWNMWKNETTGATAIEIGHGMYQCSINDVTSKAAKRVLSVCRYGKRCTFKVEIAPRTEAWMTGYSGDDVEITDRDRIISVHPGAADDSGEKGARANK